MREIFFDKAKSEEKNSVSIEIIFDTELNEIIEIKEVSK